MKAATSKSQPALPLVKAPERLALGPLPEPGGKTDVVRQPDRVEQPSRPVVPSETEKERAPGSNPAVRQKPRAEPPRATVPKKKARSASRGKAGKPTRKAKPAVLARAGSKTAKVLALLRRPQGAPLAELRKATGWQAHSVRGFLSSVVAKKMALKLESERRPGGERAYSTRG